MNIERYIAPNVRIPFDEWVGGLNIEARRRVKIALDRMAQGNRSNAKALSGGISEYRINFGPGYRIYFGQAGDRIIILLVGGSKQRQSADIRLARRLWRDYVGRI